MPMKKLGLQILGWLLVIIGFVLGLLLVRGVFLGFTRGFGAAHYQRFWIFLGYVLFLALAMYLFAIGKRSLLIAKGEHLSRTRFGWGRMLIGLILLYSFVVDHFHLLPLHRSPFKQFEPANTSEAVGMTIMTTLIVLGCVWMILSGIWRGIRSQHATS
jgi:hypothetical protein